MIGNIVDRRTNTYCWKRVTIIIEPTWHDNTCIGADQAPVGTKEGIGYEEHNDITLSDAMSTAYALPYMATVYIYDLGQGINIDEEYNEIEITGE